MNQDQTKHLETLTEIRDLMNRSSRFISLSGLSGVFAGIYALIGMGLAYFYLGRSPFEPGTPYYEAARGMRRFGLDHLTFFFIVGMGVLVMAIGTGIFFTTRKAKKKGQRIWDGLTRRLLTHLLIPLVAGGFFCLGLYYHGVTGFIAPATLIFYGLALVSASKYTYDDVKYLGIIEVGLGCLAMFYLGYGLEFWGLGFGFFHIIYGILMWYKYERGN